jgi:alpha/beta superfamily hydrolase
VVSDERERGTSAVGEARVVRLRGGDGAVGDLVGDLVVADDAWAGAVVCHPHPAYGGDRHNAVVDRIFRTLAGAGMTVLRFDFRPGTEQEDIGACVEQVAGHVGPARPLWLVGYSFGADMALAVGDERVAGWVAVAPPLHFGGPPRPGDGDGRPVLVLAAEHDQFNPPDRLVGVAAAWPDATVTVVRDADHFLAGAAGRVADAVLAWLGANGIPPRQEPR